MAIQKFAMGDNGNSQTYYPYDSDKFAKLRLVSHSLNPRLLPRLSPEMRSTDHVEQIWVEGKICGWRWKIVLHQRDSHNHIRDVKFACNASGAETIAIVAT